MAERLYSVGVIAKLLNVSERRVQQMVKEKTIPKAERGKYDLIGCVQGYVKYLQDLAFGKDIVPTDIHTTRDEAASGKTDEINVMERYENYSPGESHGIPYRCLSPKGLQNVLVAGRSISTDRIVQGSTRVMPVCLCMGEAAGLGAAMAAAGRSDVSAVDTNELRNRLKGYGAYLPEP